MLSSVASSRGVDRKGKRILYWTLFVFVLLGLNLSTRFSFANFEQGDGRFGIKRLGEVQQKRPNAEKILREDQRDKSGSNHAKVERDLQFRNTNGGIIPTFIRPGFPNSRRRPAWWTSTNDFNSDINGGNYNSVNSNNNPLVTSPNWTPSNIFIRSTGGRLGQLATPQPTFAPTASPTLSANPSSQPTTAAPTPEVTWSSTESPTKAPVPTISPTPAPISAPGPAPGSPPGPAPDPAPTPQSPDDISPTSPNPTKAPTKAPTKSPTTAPVSPTISDSQSPNGVPQPNPDPTTSPTQNPTGAPTATPTKTPTVTPSSSPSMAPTLSATTSGTTSGTTAAERA